jgi:formylglycine-generating enzyme required for sulfatase activity
MKRKVNILYLFAAGLLMMLTSSCEKQVSRTTGWEYNNPENGGFEVVDFVEQQTGPGLVLVEGGTFVMGTTQDNVNYDWNNIPRRVTVSSFYIDETEVSNIDYLEYLYWTSRVFGTDYPEVYRKALPDTLVWRDRLAFNEPLVELYLRHPAYRDYPVVGINWKQASDYCAWRTDRTNEMILVEQGILDWDPDQLNENNFNTDAYFAGQYEGLVRSPLEDLNPSGTGERKVKMEDGILLPRYRLPTEAEWEFAARGGKLSHDYTYSGSNDLDAVAWDVDNSGDTTHPVGTKAANEVGIFDLTGNIREWTWDIYGGYASSAQTNPRGAVKGSYRVLRGGSWSDDAYASTVSYRDYFGATDTNGAVGFRCVRVFPAARSHFWHSRGRQ